MNETLITIAKACGETEPLWLIVKGGFYYRPDSHGYTKVIEEAGRFSKQEAIKHCKSCNELSMEQEPLNQRNSLDSMQAAVLMQDEEFQHLFNGTLWNDKEKEVANELLEKIKTAPQDEVVQYATAYQALAQAALCRKQAEVTK